MTRGRADGGFSLLEVLVALAILAVGLSSAVALFIAATATHKRAIDRVHSAAIAEQAMADLESALARGVPREEILKNPPFETIAENWPGYEVTPKFLPLAGDTGADEVLVEITVSWKSAGAAHTQIFQQLVLCQASR